jgi:hypothetical protein
LLNRRIGKNELAVLGVDARLRGWRSANTLAATATETVLEYAQRLMSSPGTKDGLYWPPDLDGEISPFGPLVRTHRMRATP